MNQYHCDSCFLQDRLYATYFEGDENVPADLEAKKLWLKYLPEDRVIGSNAKVSACFMVRIF